MTVSYYMLTYMQYDVANYVYTFTHACRLLCVSLSVEYNVLAS